MSDCSEEDRENEKAMARPANRAFVAPVRTIRLTIASNDFHGESSTSVPASAFRHAENNRIVPGH